MLDGLDRHLFVYLIRYCLARGYPVELAGLQACVGTYCWCKGLTSSTPQWGRTVRCVWSCSSCVWERREILGWSANVYCDNLQCGHSEFRERVMRHKVTTMLDAIPRSLDSLFAHSSLRSLSGCVHSEAALLPASYQSTYMSQASYSPAGECLKTRSHQARSCNWNALNPCSNLGGRCQTV